MRTMDRTPIDSELERWVDAGIIDRTQADAIRALEREPRAAPTEGRIPLFAEVLGYVGAALAIVALWMSGSQVWDDLEPWIRVTLLGGLTVILLGGGAVMRTVTEAALVRLRNVLWAAAGLTASVTAGLTGFDVIGWDWPASLAMAGAAGVAVGGITLTETRSALHQLVLGAALAVALAGTVGLFVTGESEAVVQSIGVVFAVAGLGWLLLNRAEILPAPEAGMVLGAGGMYLGAGFLASFSGGATGWVGLAAATIVTVLGIADERRVLGWIGALGYLIFIPTLVFYYFGDALGAVLGLLVVGVLFVGGAILWTRRSHR